MIRLTKLDKSEFLVSLEAVKFIESAPDSIIFFLNGDTVIVMETLQEIEKRVEAHRSRILAQASVVQ